MIENTKFGEDVEQLELLHTAGGSENHTGSLENSLRLSYKVKHTLTIWPLLDIDPREMITDVQRLQTNVPSSFIHSWQKARNNPNTSINWWMEKQSLAYIYNGILLSNKEEWSTGVCALVAQSCPTLCGPWTVVWQASLSMLFSRQEYWCGLPLPSPGDLSNPGFKPGSPASRADSLPSEAPGKPQSTSVDSNKRSKALF